MVMAKTAVIPLIQTGLSSDILQDEKWFDLRGVVHEFLKAHSFLSLQ